MRGVLEKRPWLIIVAWILIVAITASYAVRIDEVLEATQQEFLPETAESVRAMEKIMEALQSAGEAGGSPNFMVVVHGAPVSIGTYLEIRDWYIGAYKENAPASSFTWIDIVYQVEGQIREGMSQALNSSIAAVAGMVELSAAYNETVDRINMTIALVEAADSAYAGIYSLGSGIQEALPSLRSLQQALYLACYNITPALVYTYYDVVRIEAILESMTPAYQAGYLDPADVGTVIDVTSKSTAGPVDVNLVYAVYEYTLSIGGPSAWSNEAAVNLAASLIKTGTDNITQILIDAVSDAWISVVRNDTDHRDLVKRNPVVGQEVLHSRLEVLMDNVRELAALNVLERLTEQMPEDARPLATLVGLNTVKAGCSLEAMEEVLVDSIASFLESTGLGGGAADQVSAEIVSSNFTQRDAAIIAMEMIREQAGDEAQVPDFTQLLLKYDPGANGTIKGELAIGVASIIIAEAMGVEYVEEELLSIGSIGEAAYTILKLAMGEDNAGALEILYSRGLLGAPPEAVAKGVSGALAESIAEMGNLTIDDAETLARLASMVYTGEVRLDDAVNNITLEKLADVFPQVIDGLRGIIVEKGLEGFIVVLEPRGESLEEQVDNAREAKKLLDAGLLAAGYNVESALGGQAYMEYEVREAAIRDIERSDRLSMIFVIIILVLVLESIAAVFLPFIGIGFGIVLSLAAAYVLAKQGLIDVTTQSRTIMFTTGLGLGVDYAAYVAKRFREAVEEGMDPRRAAVEAYLRSRRPVIAGAITASIGFGSMMLASDFPFIASIGSNVPLTILAVMLASITFIPALLAYVGSTRWFWWPSRPGKGGSRYRLLGLAKIVTQKPAIPLVVVAAITLVSVWVAIGFEGSYDMALNLPGDSESKIALDMVNQYYDPGTLYPLYIVPSNPDRVHLIIEAVDGLSCIARAEPVGEPPVVKAIMAVNPMGSEGVECAEAARNAAHSVDPGSLVGGLPAMNLDFRDLINQVFYGRVYPVAMALMFLTMLIAYGGVLTAAAAVVSVGLAALWGSALTVLIYQEVLGVDVIWYLPVIVFTAILGVGMDYNSFYLARAREECMRDCSIGGVAMSIARGTPIVLGLSAIMAGAYLGLTMASSPGLSQMGAALVLGVLAAGLNASLILTPPLIAALGSKSWWPSVKR